MSGHGIEFICNAMLAWSKDTAVDWHFIAPGKLMQNGFAESFNGRMRDELPNEIPVLRSRRRPRQDRQLGRRLQCSATSLVAEISYPRSLCRLPHRNGRSATQPRPASPIVRCSNRITWRTKPRGSNRRRMKTQWQVSRPTGPHRRSPGPSAG